MSRPPNYQQQQQQYPNVVNGGLIDFQDNMCHNMQMQQYSQLPQQNLMTQPSYVQVQSPQTYVQPTYVQVPQQPYVQMPQTNLTTAQPNPSSYIAGPPSYLHVNGVTYKPADEPVGMSSGLSPLSPTSVTQHELDEDFDSKVEERIRQKVGDFMNKRAPSSKSQKLSSSLQDDTARRLERLNSEMRKSLSGRNAKSSSSR